MADMVMRMKNQQVQEDPQNEQMRSSDFQNKLNMSKGGRPLPPDTNRFMSNAFGMDFSHVQIHTDKNAHMMNNDIQAKAFTHGSDIFLNQGEYAPGSPQGRKLLAHELTHVVQQSNNNPNSSPAVMRQENNSPRVRIPSLEIAGMQYGGAFSKSTRPLSSAERSVASPIFRSGINLDAVRIVETRIINAPTTLGNNIRIPPGHTMSNSTLIHELGHIWQFQTKGNAYISDSAFHQTVATLSGGSRGGAYDYNIIPGQSIHRYTAEQQAMIIQHYYQDSRLQRNAEYIRMIEEVRSSSPTLTDQQRYQESMYGPGHNLLDMQGTDPSTGERLPGTAPLLRIEF